ncbi:MAG: single-stranded-DNA-specific exonuclease RecJ [Candidatus Nitrohelix vancouverensis]|uniref:Single-stranded-DNA-specific exonuclease RecJ n=1 Tax=Candidatus Nitrohelix vancouverensis TaxID=2705534 RepID=A0A7T0G4P2_9BACT|nr:MAG: single-stranded-DNA-specific exonuclease RecJ [Candidatus Nitrohelix vancouverensis]
MHFLAQSEKSEMDAGALELLSKRLARLMARLLIRRHVVTPEEARFFLQAQLSDVHDPFLMKGMKEAAERIALALERNESITVFCDYDVDGVTSAAFLYHFFKDLDAPVEYYLPERKSEGYGVNENAVRKIAASGCTLMITADCGITANKEAVVAASLGMDMIITDHHQVGTDGLPDAVAVLNPHRSDCDYPYRFLAGVGLAFKLASGVRSELHRRGRAKESLPNLKRHLDLVALGTIADVAPLTGENHILCRHGLEVARTTSKPGLQALKEICGSSGAVDPRTVGFGLGPRLNAAGRLGKADTGFHLLTEENKTKAVALARELDDSNQERKDIQEEDFKEAEYLLDRQADVNADPAIVLASEQFHSGVIGIVASRLVEKYFRPVVLIAVENGVGKASARSIPAFNLFKAFTECGEWMLQYGGHAYAAGMTIQEEKIDSFREAFLAVGNRILTEDDFIPELALDGELSIGEIDLTLQKMLNLLEPCGAENKVPLFKICSVNVDHVRTMGKDGSHVRLKLSQNGQTIEGIGFGLAADLERLDLQAPVDLACEIQLNDWGGRRKVELVIKDIRQI